MRTSIRGFGFSGAILAGMLAFSACSPPSQQNESSPAPPTDEQREAAMAAQQLAALGGPADAATRAKYEGEFQASGALDANSGEGAWELNLLNDYAQFSRPGLGDDGGIPGERQFHERGMRVVAGPLTITIMEQACQAGPTQQPYVAHVLFEGVAYDGCARRGAGQGERPTWASTLPDLIPQIDACIGRVSSRPARVTFAGAIDDGQTNVRLREADGTRHECIVDAQGAVSAYDPISDLDRRGGEGDPEFQRAGAEPHADRCHTVTQATARDGASLGWLVRRSC